ncbi:MAG: hypothetical protein JRH20_19935 [Deltaproteobacteria bacterium]|nr:hypothetical protein [Deltaproteobacteria bacterium]
MTSPGLWKLTPSMLLLFFLIGCGSTSAPPAKTHPAPRAALGEPCKSDHACAPGLRCTSRKGKPTKERTCLAKLCQDLGKSKDCPPLVVCCPTLPGVHAGPMCLPSCSEKPPQHCQELLGSTAVCNQEAGCCFFKKVRRGKVRHRKVRHRTVR